MKRYDLPVLRRVDSVIVSLYVMYSRFANV